MRHDRRLSTITTTGSETCTTASRGDRAELVGFEGIKKSGVKLGAPSKNRNEIRERKDSKSWRGRRIVNDADGYMKVGIRES